MAKFILYCPTKNLVLEAENNEPYLASEKELKLVLKNDIVTPKLFEIKPATYLKQLKRAKEKLEKLEKDKPFKFSPPSPEFRYVAPKEQPRYLLIVGEPAKRQTGVLVKAFHKLEQVVAFAKRSNKDLKKKFSNLSYYILDTQGSSYVEYFEFTGRKSRSTIKCSGPRKGNRSGNGNSLSKSRISTPEPII